MKRFLQRVLQEIIKKIILGTSDAWMMSRLSQRPSEPAYYIEDWRISGIGQWFCLRALVQVHPLSEKLDAQAQLRCTLYSLGYCPLQSVSNSQNWFHQKYITLEIKPCGLGSKIRDMEAEWRLRVITDLIYWWNFGKQNWRCGMNQTLS